MPKGASSAQVSSHKLLFTDSFPIHLFAAQYLQKHMQYCDFSGICDVTLGTYLIKCGKPKSVIWEPRFASLCIPHTSLSYCGPSYHKWELQPNLPPIGYNMYFQQLDPMGLGKWLTEVLPVLRWVRVRSFQVGWRVELEPGQFKARIGTPLAATISSTRGQKSHFLSSSDSNVHMLT
jgi:hypothetical protein